MLGGVGAGAGNRRRLPDFVGYVSSSSDIESTDPDTSNSFEPSAIWRKIRKVI